MASDLQIAANRRNALHSTGPKTDAGKKTVSRNSIRHGLAADDVCLIDGESAITFNEILSELIEEHKPATRTEAILVERLGLAYHHSKRALYMQMEVFSLRRVGTPRLQNGDKAPPEPSPEERIRLLHRYHKDHDRSFLVALEELRACQAMRKAAGDPPPPTSPIHTQEIGFAPETFPEPQDTPEDLRQPDLPAPSSTQNAPTQPDRRADRQCPPAQSAHRKSENHRRLSAKARKARQAHIDRQTKSLDRQRSSTTGSYII